MATGPGRVYLDGFLADSLNATSVLMISRASGPVEGTPGCTFFVLNTGDSDWALSAKLPAIADSDSLVGKERRFRVTRGQRKRDAFRSSLREGKDRTACCPCTAAICADNPKIGWYRVPTSVVY